MSIENPNSSQEKSVIFREKIKELEKVTDRLGTPVDKNILETLAGLNLLDIATSSSCGGHLKSEEGRFGFPYFGGWALNEPKVRFEGEAELREKIGSKYEIKADQVARNRQASREYWDTIQTGDYKETKEYQEWMLKNKDIGKRVAVLLEDFYRDRTPSKIKLHFEKIYPGYRVEAVERKEVEALKQQEMSEEERNVKLEELVRAAQQEMAEFTEFLKQRFARSQ